MVLARNGLTCAIVCSHLFAYGRLKCFKITRLANIVDPAQPAFSGAFWSGLTILTVDSFLGSAWQVSKKQQEQQKRVRFHWFHNSFFLSVINVILSNYQKIESNEDILCIISNTTQPLDNTVTEILSRVHVGWRTLLCPNKNVWIV